MKEKMFKLKQTILIADDSEMNRSLLADMLGNEFEILEAENGVQAVAYMQNEGSRIDLVLLDIVMPKMDGFEVLAVMNRNDWIKDTPVIMISSETAPSCIKRAYELGVTDFINRPFDVWIVRRRVMNTLMLVSKQKKLVHMVTDQIFKREKMNNLMITVLSHIVEFRNGESGLHVLHIKTITELLLQNLIIKTDKYNLSPVDISLISTASALHDIGKIAIPDPILNKPGKLTPEEYEIIKTHSELGALMLDDLDIPQDEHLIVYARQICRWHHERYDGKGYPDGLKGEEIPIAAQVVSIADVFDALTSERVYKKAFSHEVALQMIANGECGQFNPLLIECLYEMKDKIALELKINSLSRNTTKAMNHVTNEILKDEELSTSARTLTLLESERIKTRFFAELSHEIQFEYTMNPSMLMTYDFGERKLGIEELIMNPMEDKSLLKIFGQEQLNQISELIKKTTPSDFVFSKELVIPLGGEERWVRFTGRALFAGEPLERTGFIGKLIDINNERRVLKELEHQATHDSLTLLYNAGAAKKRIKESLASTEKDYVMLMLDLDYLKIINDTYGHDFGNQVIQHISLKLRSILRKNDIIARIGGDEFLVFFEEHKSQDITIKRIFDALTEPFNNLQLSVSVGVAYTKTCGKEYDHLFNCADKALYDAKNAGRHCVRYYDSSLKNQTNIASIDVGEGTTVSNVILAEKTQLTSLLKNLREVYERILLVEVSTSKKYHISKQGELLDVVKEEKYYSPGRTGAYERALMTRGKSSEIVYKGKDLYYLTAIYVECASIAYILEIIIPIEEAMIKTIADKTEIIGKIDSSGMKKYREPNMNCFNRLFYDEQLCNTTSLSSVLLIEVKDASDEDMQKASGIIFESIRSTDMVLRLKDKVFLVLLKNMKEKHLEFVVKNMISSLHTENYNAYVGGYRALGKIEDLVRIAEDGLIEAYNTNCNYVIKKLKN